jgi:hypothetical protein
LETKAIYEFDALGCKRLLTIKLGKTTDSKCSFSGNVKHTEFESNKLSIVGHTKVPIKPSPNSFVDTIKIVEYNPQ